MRDCSMISRSFVVSFLTQRHPQTKTNITERNDGLIDGTKSRSRWDFGELKDFISAASQSFSFTGLHSKTYVSRKVASKTWSFKIWSRKIWISFYITADVKLPWLLTHFSLILRVTHARPGFRIAVMSQRPQFRCQGFSSICVLWFLRKNYVSVLILKAYNRTLYNP